MIRTVLFSAGAAALLLAYPASSQVRVDDPVSLEELFEELLRSPYYGSTSKGYGRAQRPHVDKVPQLFMSGSDPYTNVRYFRGAGKILTDIQDMTLYATSRDTDFEVSSLSASDLEMWKPIQISENAYLYGQWGKAWNEALQAWVLTLVDKPLYRYAGDKSPGETNGHGGDFYKLEILG